MSDIAVLAGVSKVTVAKALHQTGGKNAGVSKATAETIRKIARKLNYQPNIIARQLQGFKSCIIGVLVDSTGPAVMFDLLSKLEVQADTMGYRMMIGQTHGKIEQVESYASDFASRGVDGAFCMAWDSCNAERSQYVRKVFSQLQKIVFLGMPLVEEEVHHYVGTDIGAGIELLVRHMHARGRKKILLQVTNSPSAGNQRRIIGYNAAVQKLGLNYGPEMIHQIHFQPILENYHHDLDRFVERMVTHDKPDAILATNDWFAMQMINRLIRMGVRVPEDIAVSGFDNAWLADTYRPALTTIDQNNQATAVAAVDMMVSLIEGKVIPQEERHVKIDPILVVRESA